MSESLPYYSLSTNDVFSKLTTQKNGLSDDEVKKRLEQYGKNQLTPKKKGSAFSMYLEQFQNMLVLILLGAGVLILFIYYFGEHDPSDLIEAALIFGMVFLITILGFVQEYKAEKAIEALKKLLSFRATVRRNGQEKIIDIAELVPGDIVLLEEGAKVPADIRVLSVASLFTNEAPLTGESTPVEKIIDVLSGTHGVSDQTNMLFSGTAIVSGRGEGIVIATGDTTEIGKIAGLVAQTEELETPIQKRLDQIGEMLGKGVIGICTVVFVFIVFFAQDVAHLPLLSRIIHSFIAAVALAVAAIPEGLPAVVTITLALGTQRMLKRNTLVRKLNSIETLGSTDVICSDKTGTLTHGEMTAREIWFENIHYSVTGSGYIPEGEFFKDEQKIDPAILAEFLTSAIACNNAKLQEDGITGDPTEAALLVVAKKAGVTYLHERLFEIPFTSERKMMSVVTKNKEKLFVFVKGAPELLLNHCTIDTEQKKTILDQTRVMSEKALRVLGFAYKEVSSKEVEDFKSQKEKLEQGLTFLGLIGMIDPPRKEVTDLIMQTGKAGLRTIMITGDHIDTARAVAKEIGITGDALLGTELENLSDEELKKTVEHVSVYARVNPGAKLQIVQALQGNGHIVAMTGDGVNDAPALKRADIGIAMGITGTDVAKEASDMILLDDKFSTIIAAIEEGRGIFHNIRKFVMYLIGCNLGEVFIVFFAVLFFRDVPLSATMLLWINVITDGLPAVALGLDPAESGILKYSPRVFQSEILTKRMWIEMVLFGILLTIFSLALFTINFPHGLEQAKAVMFSAVVIFEMVDLFIIRSPYNLSFFSNRWLIVAAAGSIVLQILLTVIPQLATLFGIGHMSVMNWMYITLGSVLLFILSKAMHGIFDIVTTKKG